MDEKLKLIIKECITDILSENNSFSQYDPKKSVRTGEFRKILGLGWKNKGAGEKTAVDYSAETLANMKASSDIIRSMVSSSTADAIDIKALEISKTIAEKYRLPPKDVKEAIFGSFGKEGKELEDYATKASASLKLYRADFLKLLIKLNDEKKELRAKKEKRRAAKDAEKQKHGNEPEKSGEERDRGEKSNSSVIPQRIRDTMEKKFQHWKDTGYINLFPLAAAAPYKVFSYMLPEHYRAIAFDDDGQLVWTWVGTHEDYNDILPKEIARIKRYLNAKEQVKHRGKLNPGSKPNIFESSVSKFQPLFKSDGSLNV